MEELAPTSLTPSRPKYVPYTCNTVAHLQGFVLLEVEPPYYDLLCSTWLDGSLVGRSIKKEGNLYTDASIWALVFILFLISIL